MTRAIELTIKLIVDVWFQLRSASSLRALLLTCVVLATRGQALGLDRARSLDQFSYQTWQTGSGLPQNTVHGFLQSRDGYLWLATEGGLVRFDGYQFTVFDSRNTPAIKSDNIRSLLEDEQGSIWIATGEGLCKRKREQFETVATPRTDFLTLQRGLTGNIWAVMPSGLMRLDEGSGGPGNGEIFHIDEASSKLTGAMAVRGDGTVSLGTQSGLEMFRGGRFADASGNLPPGAVNALLLDHSSRLWVGTAKGLFESDPRDARRFEAVQGANTGAVLSLFEDWEGSVWAGTENGLTRLSANSGRTLSGVSVIAMGQDAEGDLWVGTESEGATVIRNQKFVAYTARDGLAGDSVRCVFSDAKGVVSVGTSAGLTQMNAGRFKSLNSASGLASDVILSLGDDAEGNLLIGTPDGLNRFKDGKVSLTTSADGLADDFVRSIYRDRDGSLWIGTRRGLSHETGNRFTTYTQADGLGSDLVGAILRDSHGDLWAATLGGLSRWQNGRFSTYRTRDGLSSNIITALYEDAEGDLWIGTQEAGLNVRHREKFSRLPGDWGLPQAIFGIAEDGNGEFWIASQTGIARASKSELKNAALERNSQATVVWYGTSDGLRVSECSVGGHPDVWKARDGTIWFSTLKGVAALYPDAARLNRVLPPVVIESVQVDDRTLTPVQAGKIAAGHSRIAFDYAALSFAAPQKVRYRYRLEGFDNSWIEAGSQRTAYYTNIPPGGYRFRVLARNNDGFWNEAGAVLSFRLLPHFYQTIWFYALLAMGLAGASLLIYRWRVAEVEARFGAVLQERNRIAREIHDTLAQGFVGVSMQLEIVSRLLASSLDGAREHLDEARVQVRESLSEARRSIWQLRSQSSESEDFAARLSKAAKQAIGLSPVQLSLEVHGTYRPLRPNVEDELLRIGQEAVTNAVRHASAERIDIELAYAAKRLRMTIADDGRGFAVGSYVGPNGHFGLQGMRERAEQINARLVVDSAAGKGTKVLVEAPLS